MKPGDLVQVLPAKIGYYIILKKSDFCGDHGPVHDYWDLWPLPGAAHDHGGCMREKFMEIVSEI